MTSYFDFEAAVATLHIPYDDAPELIARNAAAMKPAAFVAFLEALAEAMGEDERAAVEKEFRALYEHRRADVLDLFDDLTQAGGDE